MIDKLLRPFIPDQLKALCEKLENQEFDTRSLGRLGNFLSELRLTRFERYVVGRVYKRVRRLHDLNRVIEEIIIGQSEDVISADINAKLRMSMDGSLGVGTTAPTAVMQARRVVPRQTVENRLHP
jgi:hypothetical protein